MAVVKCSVFGRRPASRRGGAAAELFAQPTTCCEPQAPSLSAPANNWRRSSGAEAQPQLERLPPPADTRPFDVINYFLLTRNGQVSAHDAISGLQVSRRRRRSARRPPSAKLVRRRPRRAAR